MAFDVTKLPRQALLAEAFPGQSLHEKGWGKVRCTLPNCEHANGDKSPSLSVNVEGGGFECMVNGTSGKGWKAFVTTFWDEGRWKDLLRKHMGSRTQPSLRERWDALRPEEEWTRSLGIAPDLVRNYLRQGVRYPGDPESRSVIAIRRNGVLIGIKWRLPSGATWKVGGVSKTDPTAKYALTKGSEVKAVFLAELPELHSKATVLVCAGEKDALVAASHLSRDDWAPVSGCFGEGKVPRGLREVCKGRRVVVAYDGDDAGRGGAWKVARFLRGHAHHVTAARFPEDTPPGAPKPGWDVSDVILHRGPRELLKILEAAQPVPEEWKPKGAKDEPEDDPPLEPIRRDGPGQIEHALDDWGELEGQVVKWRRQRTKRGQPPVLIPTCKFRGLPRCRRVKRLWSEDPDEPTGWAEEEEVLYEFRLVGGRVITRRAGPGQRAFDALLDSTDLAEATEATSREDRSRLYLWTLQASTDRQTTEERQAVGPHGDFGWLAPGGARVRKGTVEPVPFRVGPPHESEEFKRYRLQILNARPLRQTCRWIVDQLLNCDHADGAYALPLMGAFMSAPLWEYLRQLGSWQRYAFFVQGSSGIGKSQLSRYFWSFWGDFRNGEGLTTWISSATYIEGLLYQAKGVPLFVSDWKRANLSHQRWQEAMALLQAYADRSSRGRAKRGGASADRKRPPRCTWVIDGEDLPEGEQSTLGRMVILEVGAHGPHKRCADADDSTLDPLMVANLPGVTARWISWVQKNRDKLSRELDRVALDLEGVIPQVSTNRSRLVRNYAVQVLSALAFTYFLEDVGGVGDLEFMRDKIRFIHQDMACKQIGAVRDESAASQFVVGLVNLLSSGSVHLRPQEPEGTGEPFSGPHPFGKPQGLSSTCVGTYHHGTAYVWPGIAVPAVNRHMSQGGGGRIEFSQKAIGQQLLQEEVITGRPRQRVGKYGHRKERIVTWAIPITELGGKTREQAYAES